MSIANNMKKLTLILTAALLLASCEGTPVRFSQSSDMAQGQKFDMSKGRTITAEACGFQLWLFIPIVTNQRAVIAYSKLQSQAGNGYLTDIRVQETWTYAFVGTLYCTVMEGTVYPPAQT
jgi:hypothetical protein